MDTIRQFKPRLKVSLKGEFGVVIDSENSDLSGIIRWDNPNENDFEDWRGLFGSFLQSGGEILNDDFAFKYINDDGTLKSKHD